jgi:hypothetical protein
MFDDLILEAQQRAYFLRIASWGLLPPAVTAVIGLLGSWVLAGFRPPKKT